MQTKFVVHFKRTINQNWKGDKGKGKDQNWNQSLSGRPDKHEQLHIPTISTKKQGDLPVDFAWTGHTTQEFKTILSTRSSYHSSWNELLQDPRELSLSIEIDHILNQEYAISASLSELDMMLRNLESEDIPLPSTEEKTNAREEDNAWITLGSIWTMANYEQGGYIIPPSYKHLKNIYTWSNNLKLMLLVLSTILFLRYFSINEWCH